MDPVLFSSANQNHETPDELLELIRYFKPIAFDPCTTESNPTKAEAFIPWPKDGLIEQWETDGLIFVNSPYGRSKKLWAARTVEEARKGGEIVDLSASRTDTKWWQSMASVASVVVFLRGRLTFKGSENPAPFPSSIMYFGSDVDHFVRVFDGLGVIYAKPVSVFDPR